MHAQWRRSRSAATRTTLQLWHMLAVAAGSARPLDIRVNMQQCTHTAAPGHCRWIVHGRPGAPGAGRSCAHGRAAHQCCSSVIADPAPTAHMPHLSGCCTATSRSSNKAACSFCRQQQHYEGINFAHVDASFRAQKQPTCRVWAAAQSERFMSS